MKTFFAKGTKYIVNGPVKLTIRTDTVSTSNPFSKLAALFPVHNAGRPTTRTEPVITFTTSNPDTLAQVGNLLAAA